MTGDTVWLVGGREKGLKPVEHRAQILRDYFLLYFRKETEPYRYIAAAAARSCPSSSR